MKVGTIVTGTIEWLEWDKHYGFVYTHSERRKVYFCKEDRHGTGRDPKIGDVLTFELVKTWEGCGLKAKQWRLQDQLQGGVLNPASQNSSRVLVRS